MEFQISPALAHLFADALAAFMRGNADTVWLNEQLEVWDELSFAFSNADNATVRVSFEAGAQMWQVWGNAMCWRDIPTWMDVKSILRPQWKEQMKKRVFAHVASRTEF